MAKLMTRALVTKIRPAGGYVARACRLYLVGMKHRDAARHENATRAIHRISSRDGGWCLVTALRVAKSRQDEELVGLVLETLMRLNERLLLVVIRSYVSGSDVSDLIQDVWLAIISQLDKPTPPTNPPDRPRRSRSNGSFQSWLLKIARNKAIDFLRARARQLNMAKVARETRQVIDWQVPHAAIVVYEEELFDQFRDVFRQLPAARQELARLSFLDIPYEDIALILEVPEGSVKGWMNLVRKELVVGLRKSMRERNESFKTLDGAELQLVLADIFRGAFPVAEPSRELLDEAYANVIRIVKGGLTSQS